MPLVPLLARWSNPFTWRRPRAMVDRLVRFAAAELNTLVELEQAANRADPALSAAFLVHGADEVRHARMFVAHANRLAREAGLPPVGMPRTDTARLYDTLGEHGFIAFMHHGEARGHAQFETYRDFLLDRDPKGSAMFGAILIDEARHAGYTADLLADRQSAGVLRRIRLWELWRTVRTVQRATARGLFVVAFMLLAPFLWILGPWTRWTRPERRGLAG